MTASEDGSVLSRRSSSQLSRLSSESKRAKDVQVRPRGNPSKPSATAAQSPDPALTSFPSFSPEQSTKKKEAKSGDSIPVINRTISQKARERSATLAKLTSGSPLVGRQNALFQDSPHSSNHVPGSLHLAGDDHINRLIARTGAIKLVRQFAEDLAQRDAELTSLRIRADTRERELKKLLREANVATADIEKRLLRLEQLPDPFTNAGTSHTAGDDRMGSQIGGMMNEAFSDTLGLDDSSGQTSSPTSLNAVEDSAVQSIKSRPASISLENTKSSKAPSVGGGMSDQTVGPNGYGEDATIKPRTLSGKSNRLRGLEGLFQPPSVTTSYFIGGHNKAAKKPKAVDEISVRSNQSGSSFASWTKLFGGQSQTRKEEAGRPRSLSVEQSTAISSERSDDAAPALTKVQTASAVQASKYNITSALTGTMRVPPTGRRLPIGSRLSTSPGHARKESNASDLPPTVEMDSMIESSQLPPTMASQKSDVDGILTDRFGFIYDQRQRKRQAAAVLQHKKNKLSAAQTLASFRGEPSAADTSELEQDSATLQRPSTPISLDEDQTKKSWQDYLKVPTNINLSRPRELLAHTPSSSAVVTVNATDATGTITPPSRHRETSVALNAPKAVAATGSPMEATQSDVTVSSGNTMPQIGEVHSSDKEPVRMLLDQLNDLHDTLQAERTVKWNEFLRRVRAERATNLDRNSNNAPEAEQLNGEVGINSLGRSPKTKAKYLQFKDLVLHGIPTTLRPKTWSECAGASMLRIPGYYDDLVVRSEEGFDVDQEIASQIKVDVRRTLPDNTFFRNNSRGVPKLFELLLAYSLHNPKIGYCQGMNLIAASLLLICPTSEESFWLLVAIIDHILPGGYFDRSLLVSRADQIILRGYVAEVLPKLDAKLQELGVELEACTFHWFLSLYAGVLTGGEALYRVWDCVLCLNSSDTPNVLSEGRVDISALTEPRTPVTPTAPEAPTDAENHDGTCSSFLIQLGLALLKLNEQAILGLESASQVYTYVNHNICDHAISIDALIQAAEALRTRVKRVDVIERRKLAVEELTR